MKKSIINLLKFTFATLMVAFTVIATFAPELIPEFLTVSGMVAAGGMSVGRAGYYDQNGSWVGSKDSNGRIIGDSILMNQVLPQASQCGNADNFIMPSQFTLNAVGGAAATTFKFTQADDMTEATIGEIGTDWFTVSELPFADGTIVREDGTTVFAAQSLAQSLQSYGLKIYKIQASGTAIANTTSLIIDYWKTNLSGAAQGKWKLDIDTTNQQSAGYTLVLVKDIDLLANMSFRLIVPGGAPVLNLQLTFYIKGQIPYN